MPHYEAEDAPVPIFLFVNVLKLYQLELVSYMTISRGSLKPNMHQEEIIKTSLELIQLIFLPMYFLWYSSVVFVGVKWFNFMCKCFQFMVCLFYLCQNKHFECH